MDLKSYGSWSLAVLMLGISTAALAQTTVTYIHTDALGSVVATSDEAGNVTHTREYEPYGYQLGGLSEGVGYAGHVQDPTTGLVYMQQRYYDPLIGRFLSIDPVQALDDPVKMFGRYHYANNNPYRFTDPDGRRPTGHNAPTYEEAATTIGIAADVLEAVDREILTPLGPMGMGPKAAVIPLAAGARTLSTAGKISGTAQVTRAGGRETTHAATSARIAAEQAARPDVQSVHLNQQIRTITNGEVPSQRRPDVAAVRTDGRVEVTEVLSPGQRAESTVPKYQNALGDRAGSVTCVQMDSC